MIHPAYIRTRLRLAWHHWTTRPNPNTLNRWVYEFTFLPDYDLPAGMPSLPRRNFYVMRAVADYLERVKPVNYQQWLVAWLRFK